jgi:hypothetical protein
MIIGEEADNAMREYQAVMLRLTHHTRDDEESLTDLLNERFRAGWKPTLTAQGTAPGGDRLTIIFERATEPNA